MTGKCKWCHAEFKRHPQQQSRLYCSDKCRAAAYRHSVPIEIRVSNRCLKCGKMCGGKRYCGAECRVAYNRAREKEARKASRKGLPPRLNVAPPQSRIWEGYER